MGVDERLPVPIYYNRLLAATLLRLRSLLVPGFTKFNQYNPLLSVLLVITTLHLVLPCG